jgi:hypothetical protein
LREGERRKEKEKKKRRGKRRRKKKERKKKLWPGRLARAFDRFMRCPVLQRLVDQVARNNLRQNGVGKNP